jgi:hypothetical protein
LSVPADPYATAPLPMPWQAEVFAPIDQPVPAAESPPPALADAAFRRPTPDVLGPIDLGRLAQYQTPLYDTNWQRSTPFAFEPLDPTMMARLQKYQAVPKYGHPSMLDAGPYTASTRAKIADAEAFGPAKSLLQQATEDFLRDQRVSPAGWRLARPVDAETQQIVKKVGELFPAVEPWLFFGPDGQVYRRNEFSAEDEISKRIRVAEFLRGQPLSPGQPSLSLWDLAPEVVLAMAASPGRRGLSITRAQLRQIEDYLKATYPNFVHRAGGSLPERAIPGPGAAWYGHPDGLGGNWKPGARFPDLIFDVPGGRPIAINTVDVDRKGQIMQYELDAARAIHAMGYDVYLIKKTHQMLKLGLPLAP